VEGDVGDVALDTGKTLCCHHMGHAKLHRTPVGTGADFTDAEVYERRVFGTPPPC
jgi:hypothetical protein